MNRRAAFYLIVVFVLGVALGILGNQLAGRWELFRRYPRSYERGPRGGPEWLSRELGLSAEQQRQLETILDETGKQFQQVRQRVREDYERVRQQSGERIRAILTEEQRTKFEELLRRMEAERLRRGRSPSPPFPPERKK